MGYGLPDHIDSLVKVGYETGEETDRLLALRAANHADQTGQSQHGLNVAEIFLDQLGLGLEPGTEPVNAEGWGVEIPRVARVMREVSRAIGARIEARVKFHEFIGTSINWSGSIVLVDDESVGRIETPLSPNRPFFITRRYGNNRSHQNFGNTVRAITGITENGRTLDQSWLDTLAKIRSLEER